MTNKAKRIALVTGDGAAPEMMKVSCDVFDAAAKKFEDKRVEWVDTPMGWNAWAKYKTTFPEESFRVATECGILFFGGVGDPVIDRDLGVKYPDMRPEAKCLLPIRDKWGLLLNFRPVEHDRSLNHLSNLKESAIPVEGVNQYFIRCLLEDTYFGTKNLFEKANEHEMKVLRKLGFKLKSEVTGDEDEVYDAACYTKKTLEKYFRAAFTYAREKGLPVISVDKANVMPRYLFWRLTMERIQKEEFPDVELKGSLYVDAVNELLFSPAKLHGVIICGNEHGDILSDGAIASASGLGMMCSSAINPTNGMAMFESGAGTAADKAGLDVVNPIGRIKTGAMIADHIGWTRAAAAIRNSVNYVLTKTKYRTKDIAKPGDTIVGCSEMGRLIIQNLHLTSN